MTDADAGHDEAAPVDAGLAEGMEHLQRAAREMIAASRAVLDVAERLVDDPDTMERMGAAIGSVATRTRRGSRVGFDPDSPEEGPVERIRVD